VTFPLEISISSKPSDLRLLLFFYTSEKAKFSSILFLICTWGEVEVVARNGESWSEPNIAPVQFEWLIRHIAYPNMHEGYSWEDEDWWMAIFSLPGETPEVMGHVGESSAHREAIWRTAPDWLLEPVESIYKEGLNTTDRERRFQLYKKANEYTADQVYYGSPEPLRRQ
jgi:ABC-type transport system substrate-binding protein